MNTSPNFTAEQIKTAHAKVKTGADFPKYTQELKSLGVLKYDYIVKDGSSIYRGANDYNLPLEPKYEALKIADESSAEKLRETIKIHQQGQTDFPTFCQQAADAGVERWIVDLEKMATIYFDKAGKELVSEPVPTGEY